MIVLWILGALVLFYLYLTRNFNYWQKRGIPCLDNALPGVGHLWKLVTMRETLAETYRKIYNDNKNRSMVGFYNFTSPSLMILEPELVKTVLQTNFANFHENGLKIDPNLDPLLAYNPFFSNGDKWVNGRKRLTYAFSSMRLKILLENVKLVCEQFENFLDRRLKKTEKVELELKDLFSRFTAQVVAKAGFGVDGLSFEDEKEQESFQKMGKSFLEPSFLNTFFFTVIFFMPFLNKVFRISFLPKKIDRFFRKLTADIIEKRKTDGTPKNDFLQLMLDMQRTEGNQFDLEILTSSALSFFLDGYETSSIVLSFVGFQLASHPAVQDKLREEVMTILDKYNGMITYDALKEMTYMNQVISESQRIIATGPFQSKICTETFELRGSDGLVCRVEPKTEIIIPTENLQIDPQYWDSPEVFNPERFSPDKKHSIEKFAFLPFGEGPRNCVGMRMAMLQMKACLAVLLRKYNLELSPRTQTPLKINASNFLSTPVGGLWAYIRPI